ncbi:hypothetical protein L596_004400 [Steinernema carpocapsae]|uniref:Vitellogenin domain-containing protein n=1 Tax=Steinernema carpocapsae TaxID=34508 RepID=A0A4U8UZA1_STECR|nr:hypothetical protein L596_004400 [Steinernema carpocapsae]
MRLLLALLGLLAVGSVFGSSWDSSSEVIDLSDSESQTLRGFPLFHQKDREYHFDYDVQYDSGMAGSADEHSFTRVQAKVSVAFKDHKTLLWQLKDIVFAKANIKVAGTEILPMDKFKTVDVVPELRNALQLPMMTPWDSGLLLEVTFDERDTVWSKNFKRGLMSSYSIDVSKIDKLGDSYADQDADSEDEAKEVTVEGECAVLYTRKVPNNGQKTFNVTKTINFKDCTRRADLRYNFRFASKCSTCAKCGCRHNDKDGEQKPVNSESVDSTARQTLINIVMSGTEKKFLFHRIDVVSQYVTPFLVTRQETDLTTFVLGRITYTGVRRLPLRSEDSIKKGLAEDMLYSLEWDVQEEKFYMQGDDGFANRDKTPFAAIQHKVETVVNLLKSLEKGGNDKQVGLTKEKNQVFGQAVYWVRMMTKTELGQVQNKVANEARLEELFMSIVTTSSTMNTIDFFVEKVLNKKVSPMSAAMAMKKFINVMVPSDQQIQKMLQLCKSDLAKEKINWHLRQSCYLTVSTLMHALCHPRNDRMATQEKQCDADLKKTYLREINDFMHSASGIVDKMVGMKTLQNAALDISVGDLEKYIRDRKMDKYVRGAAIEALYHLTDVMPRKIVRILLPIFNNHHENSIVRMSAFHKIAHTYPDRHILASIVATLAQERNSTFTNFVLDCLVGFRASQNPCLKRISDELTYLLTTANFDVHKFYDFGGKLFGLNYYSPEMQTGVFMYHYSATGSKELFRNDAFGMDSVFNGHWHNDIFRAGIFDGNRKIERGLQKAVNFVNEQLFKAESEGAKVRGTRHKNLGRDMLKDLAKSLRIKGRKNEEKGTSVFFIRYKDFEQLAMPIEVEAIERMAQTVSKIPYLRSSQNHEFTTSMAMNLYEVMSKMPTSLGLPLVVISRSPVTFRAAADLIIGTRRNEMEFAVDLHVTAAQSHVAMSEVWSPVVSSGVQQLKTMEMNLPISLTTKLSKSPDSVLKMTYNVPNKIQNIASFRTMPQVFVQVNEVDGEPQMQAMTMINRAFKHSFFSSTTPVAQKYTGVPLVFHENRYALINPVQTLLSGQNDFQLTVEPTKDSVKKIEVTMKAEYKKTDREVVEKKDLLEDFYGNSEENKIFAMEGLSTSEDKERMEDFTRLMRNWPTSSDVSTYNLKLFFAGVGGLSKHEAELDLEYQVGKEGLCSTIINVKRTPIREMNEESEWKLTYADQMLRVTPEMSLDKHHAKTHKEFAAVMKAEWGLADQEKSSIKIKVQGEPTFAVRETLRRHKEGLFRRMAPMERLVLLENATQWRIFKFQVAHDNLNNGIKKWSYDTLAYMRLSDWFYTTHVDDAAAERSNSDILATLTVDGDYQRYFNMSIKTDSEQVKFHEIPVFMTPSSVIEMLWPNIHPSSKRSTVLSKSQCIVKRDRINTFSGKRISIPTWATDCYTLLAKDCSALTDDETPKFAVMTKELESQSEFKKLRLIVGENVFDVEMNQSDRLQVKINKIEKETEEIRKVHGMELRENVFQFENSDVYVSFDGKKIVVHVSALHHNTQCGLCDKYNDDDEYLFEKPDQTTTNELRDFHESYIEKTDECTVTDAHFRRAKNYRKDLAVDADDLFAFF